MLYALQVDIFESKPYPVTRHVFYGATKDEARGYFEAHAKADAFLRGCVEKNQYNGIQCSWTTSWRRINFSDAKSVSF